MVIACDALSRQDRCSLAMKRGDYLVISAVFATFAVLIYSIAVDGPPSDFCLRLRVGLCIGDCVLLATWCYARLGARP